MSTAISERMPPEHAALLIVDIQERLAPAIKGIEGIVLRNKALIAAARRLDVPILFTEQYPNALPQPKQHLLAKHGMVTLPVKCRPLKRVLTRALPIKSQ